MAKLNNSALGNARMVNEAEKPRALMLATDAKDSDGKDYQKIGYYQLWTKSVSGERHVRALVKNPFSHRYDMVTVAPGDVEKDTVTVYRVDWMHEYTSKNDNASIAHDRDFKDRVYTLVGFSTEKKKTGKTLFLKPVQTINGDGKTKYVYEVVDAPVAMNSRCTREVLGVTADTRIGQAIKQNVADFIKVFGEDSDADKYVPSWDAKLDIADVLDKVNDNK